MFRGSSLAVDYLYMYQTYHNQEDGGDFECFQSSVHVMGYSGILLHKVTEQH